MEIDFTEAGGERPDVSLTFNEIKSLAEGLLIASGVARIYPVPLERVAQHLGFESLAFDGGKEISGAINYAEKKIYINQNENPQRQRFTLAHEIGHAKLHKGEDIIDYRANIDSPDPTKPKEIEANHFAANLLMPVEDFIPVWRERDGDLSRVANYFGVSISCAQVRVKSLKLI